MAQLEEHCEGRTIDTYLPPGTRVIRKRDGRPGVVRSGYRTYWGLNGWGSGCHPCSVKVCWDATPDKRAFTSHLSHDKLIVPLERL